MNALGSALQAPFAGFGDTYIYPEDAQRLGILCSRIVLNHPFLDGNKRTGLIGMLTMASMNSLTLDLPVSTETDSIILRLAAGETDEEAFVGGWSVPPALMPLLGFRHVRCHPAKSDVTQTPRSAGHAATGGQCCARRRVRRVRMWDSGR